MQDIQDLLRKNETASLLRFTTAGSVDDGKSTLIGRILHDSKSIYEDHLEAIESASKSLNREEVDVALLTDGLRAEREQGITIDVAYRYFSTPKRRFIIADTPGHEQYTRNMVTGASTANLAIILIDARHGMTTQSKRHGFIASLLGIQHLIVAVNKMDLVDYSEEAYTKICDEYTAFATKLNILDLKYIPISALKGDNVVNKSERMKWYDGITVLSHLETVYIGSDRNLIDLRFPVQYVNRPNLDFRGFCGTVASGVVRVGDEIMVLPSRKTSKVSRITTYEGELTHAFPPQSITICLEDEIDISRGDMLVHPNNQPNLTRNIEAMITWMDDTPLKIGQAYHIKHTTNTVRGVFNTLSYKIDPNELHRENATQLKLNEIGRVKLELLRPIACDEYTRNRQTGAFIVIDSETNATVAAGTIIKRSGEKTASEITKPVSKNITLHTGEIATQDKSKLLNQSPTTLWFTGLSGSGKSTIAYAVEKRLTEIGKIATVLDGDNIRHGLNKDLGFSATDRTENIRRVAEVARLFNDAGIIAITSFISPYIEDRKNASKIIGADKFLEIHLSTPLSDCETRDPKGLYKKAREGVIPQFTGVSAPYEEPKTPCIKLNTAEKTVAECVEIIIEKIIAVKK